MNNSRDELTEALTAHVPAIDQRETFCLCGVSTGIYNDTYGTHIIDVLDTLVSGLLAAERERCLDEITQKLEDGYEAAIDSADTFWWDGKHRHYTPEDLIRAIRAAGNEEETP